MLYKEQYTDTGLLLPGNVQTKRGPNLLRVDGMYNNNNIERPVKEGTLKSLVSKFESLSSPPTSKNSGEKAAKGWRPVAVLKNGSTELCGEESSRTSLEIHHIEGKHVSAANSVVPPPFVNIHGNMDLECQTSPTIRSKKEGQKRHGVFGVESNNNGFQSSPFEVNGNGKVVAETGLKSKTERPGERKESLVQMRIRLLEQSQKTRQKYTPAILKEKKVERLEGRDDGFTNTPTSTRNDGPRSGIKDRDGAELHILHPHISSEHPKSPSFPRAVTSSSETSVTSPKASLEMHAPYPANQRLETTTEPESKAQQQPIKYPPLKVLLYRFGAKEKKEASPKNLAPEIRERVEMFESAKGSENVGLIAVDGPEAWFRGRKSKAKHELQGGISGGIKEAVRENHIKVGWPGPPTANQVNKMSAFSECLAERRRSRTGCTVDGKYVSAFVHRRKAKETSTSTSWATTTASGESEPASPNEKPIIQIYSRPANPPNGVTSSHIPQHPSEQQTNSSCPPISWSSYSGPRPHTISDSSHKVSLPSASWPPPVPPESASTRPRLLVSASLCAMNPRASDIIAKANGCEQFAASRRIARGHMGRNNMRSMGTGAWVDSSDDEDGTLIVQSVAKLREPRPLRMTEVSSLEKICRLGRCRGDLE
ncbi:hypothetical protein O988_01055 [Pseudogymnoascus sp. VKM F-3808]|nr:hypothetical protein O988_01055 [Pseudogymnoascus sp. VKM F-3808]